MRGRVGTKQFPIRMLRKWRRQLFRYLVTVALIVLCNVLLLHYISYCRTSEKSLQQSLDITDRLLTKNETRNYQTRLTVVLCEYEEFSNNLEVTVTNLSRSLESEMILVVADQPPYPPIHLSHLSNVRLVVELPDLKSSVRNTRPENMLLSRYVMFVPDSVRLIDRRCVDDMIGRLETARLRDQRINVIVRPLVTHADCYDLDFDVRRWTLTYHPLLNSSTCSAVVVADQSMIVLLSVDTLLTLTHPFLLPLPTSLFIQNSLRGGRVLVDHSELKGWIRINSGLFTDPHAVWKRDQNEKRRLRAAFSKLGVKLVHWAVSPGAHRLLPGLLESPSGDTGTRAESSTDPKTSRAPLYSEHWYGCSRDTPRCFGSVVDDTPDYLTRGRWTPPCCLHALRVTARYVFRVLEGCRVRYWLEGGSLLGAARGGEIIEWDYDVDIGVYRTDLIRCSQLG